MLIRPRVKRYCYLKKKLWVIIRTTNTFDDSFKFVLRFNFKCFFTLCCACVASTHTLYVSIEFRLSIRALARSLFQARLSLTLLTAHTCAFDSRYTFLYVLWFTILVIVTLETLYFLASALDPYC